MRLAKAQFYLNQYPMATLQQDIKAQASWIVKAFKADELKLDYTIDSFKEIDKFFDVHSKHGQPIPNGRLSQNLGPILFSIGAYVGETLIKNVPGTVWQTDESEEDAEITAALLFPDGGQAWPMQKVIKRFQNGEEDGIYAYGFYLTKDVAVVQNGKKPFWKFW
jgi:hypothetical protein